MATTVFAECWFDHPPPQVSFCSDCVCLYAHAGTLYAGSHSPNRLTNFHCLSWMEGNSLGFLQSLKPFQASLRVVAGMNEGAHEKGEGGAGFICNSSAQNMGTTHTHPRHRFSPCRLICASARLSLQNLRVTLLAKTGWGGGYFLSLSTWNRLLLLLQKVVEEWRRGPGK